MVTLELLPPTVRTACEALRDRLQPLLGEDLVALWVHGAVTFEDAPRQLGDVDTYAVVRAPPTPRTARAIEAIHEATGRERGVEWDSWYVLDRDAAGAAPPAHALRADLVDDAWPLHRAHWLAGQYVPLHGRAPSDLVRVPTWAELEEGLRGEARFLQRVVRGGRLDGGHAAFVISNGCRIIRSVRTKDVVVSKRAAGRWALDHLPPSWHPPIRAAERAYDGVPEPGDGVVLLAAAPAILAVVEGAVAGGAADAVPPPPDV